MTSTINSYKNQVKHINPRVIIEDESQRMLQVTSYNPYYIDVVLTVPVYRDVLCIKIDHKSLHASTSNINRASFNWNDLRIIDLADDNELDFYVQNQKTSYCTIYIKRPNNTGQTTLRLFMGNSMLESKSDLSHFIPQHSSLKAWYRSDAYDEFRNYLGFANDPIVFWKNQAEKSNGATRKYSDIRDPIAVLNQKAGLPIARFDGSKKLMTQKQIKLSDEITIITVVKASTLANYQSAVRMQENGAGWVIHFWGGNAEIRLSNDDATPYLSSGAVANEWNICVLRWKQNTTNGFNTYRNGTLISQRNSTNTPLPSRFLYLGALENNTEFFNGDLAETLIWDKYLSDTELTQITKVLNAKWEVYDSHPTYTIGALAGNADLATTTTDVSSVSNYSLSNKLSNNYYGINETTGELKYSNQQNKSICTCSSKETWFGSTLSQNKEFGEWTRQSTLLYGMPVESTVVINEDLTVFNNGIVSTLNDYIEISILLESIVGLDNANCGLNVSDGTNNAIAVFSTLDYPLIEGLNIIKIKKSSFTGTINWANITNFSLILASLITGTPQTIKFGRIRLVQNITENPFLQVGQMATLGHTVSDDNLATTYNSAINLVKITEVLRSDNDVTMNLSNIYNYCKEKKLKMGDLPAFGDYDYIFKSYVVDGHSTETISHLRRVEFVLGFLTQRNFMSTNSGADWSIYNATYPNPTSTAFDVIIHKSEYVSDVIEEMLSDTFFTITRSLGVPTLIVPPKRTIAYDASDGFLTPFIISEDWVYSYGQSASHDDTMINQIRFDLSGTGVSRDSVAFAFDGGDMEYELPANSTTTLFFDIYSSEELKARKRKIVGNIRVDGWNAFDTQGSGGTLDTTNISVMSSYILDYHNIAIVIKNTAGGTRWIRTLAVVADYIDYKAEYINDTFFGSPINILPPLVLDNGAVYLRNNESIKKYGVKEHVISSANRYQLRSNAGGTQVEFGTDIAFVRILEQLSKPAIIHELEMQYIQEIHPSLLVEFRNENGKKVTGFVISTDHYDTTMKIKIREIN